MEKDFSALVHAVKGVWDKAVCLTPEIRHFLESGCGITLLPELEEELKRPDSPDRDMILEMLVFPDRESRLVLEPLLPADGFDTSCLSDLIDTLCLSPDVIITDPVAGRSVGVPASEDLVRLFIQRLFLDKPLDPGIVTMLESAFPEETGLACRVSLRCESHELSEEKAAFLVRFIEKMGADSRFHPDGTGLFETGLRMAADAPETGTVESFILHERRRIKKMLTDILRFEEEKDRFSMEYMMMSGVRAPQDSYENTLKKLQTLDLIIYDILEISCPSEPLPPPVRDFGRFDPGRDMDLILDILS